MRNVHRFGKPISFISTKVLIIGGIGLAGNRFK